jgi:hypothetical protein
MPFGLSNATNTFMCLTINVLCSFIDSFVIVYLDNILIFRASCTFEVGVGDTRETQT